MFQAFVEALKTRFCVENEDERAKITVQKFQRPLGTTYQLRAPVDL